MTNKISLPPPIYIGRCFVNTECGSKKYPMYNSVGTVMDGRYHPGYVGVRFISPSATEEGAYIPTSDVYMCLTDIQVQELAAYFGSLARKVTGVED